MSEVYDSFIKKKIFYAIKIVVSLSLLIFLLSKVEWEKTILTLQNAEYGWLIIAILLTLLDSMLLTYKWNLLLKVRNKIISFWRLLAINMIGGFWGLFLPSSISTDIVRGYYLIKDSSDKAISVTSIIVDRLLALIALMVFVGIAILFSGGILKDFHLGYYVMGFFLILIFVLYLFSTGKFSKLLENIRNRFENNKIVSGIDKLKTALFEYNKYPLTLFSSFSIALLVQFLRVFWYVAISWAFGIYVPVIYYFIFCPIIIVILMVPVSIGGLGVREGSFVAFFTLAGMSLDEAVLVSFTSSLIVNLVTVSGGIVYLFYKSENKLTDPVSIAQSELNV